MAIMNNFQFSQASLQDFKDCRRRFYLRYVQKLAWPALEAEPVLENEAWLQQGAEFHRLVHQYLQGVPSEMLSKRISGKNLSSWWENFLMYTPVEISNQLFPERVLATQLEGHPLIAKFDLVAIEEKTTLVIYDWKTSRHPGSRSKLAQRLQTKVYPYVLAKAGNPFLDGEDISPERIKMVYWYASRPNEPEVFQYRSSIMQLDEEVISQMIMEIDRLSVIEDFPLTEERSLCGHCVYRSLCDRGKKAGDLDAFEDEILPGIEETLDFDHIQEIEF